MSGTTVGIVLYPDAEELDWAGPYEVFTMAAMGQDLQVVTIAEQPGPVRCAKGLRVLADHTFESAPRSISCCFLAARAAASRWTTR